MRQLDRKLLRDIWHMKGQVLAITLVIASGIATFVMSLSTRQSLQLTRDAYYERYRFAQVFAPLKRAPKAVATRIAQLPGVAQVQVRTVVDVTLDVPGMLDPATGRLHSIPDYSEPTLNDLHLRAGRYIDPHRPGEVLVNEAFAQAHGFGPGDRVRVIINGQLQELTMVGVVLSPEYVLQVRAGDALPDNRRFGVFWMGQTQLEAVFDMEGAFNHVSVRLMRGASEPDVIARLDRLLEPYGGVGAYGRDEHVSARFIADEIKQLRAVAVIAPSIFLSVAAFLLNVVATRLIGTQREQIAALKAFGYTRWQIGAHYLKFVLLVTLVGVLLGTALGARLGRGLTAMYTVFYHFPEFQYRFEIGILLLAVGISLGAAVLGTLGAVRRAAALPPAEALRPEPPARFRPTVLERLGFQRLFSPTARMILRQLERRPLKSLFSSFGIALAVSVLVLGNFGIDALDELLTFQFQRVQRQDVSVTFVEPTTGSARYELEHLPGVLRCEAFRSVPVRLHSTHYSRRVAIMGLEQQRELFRLLDSNGREIPLPAEGLLLSDKLAELLHVQPGDQLTLHVVEGRRPVRQVPVLALINDFSGTNAYMEISALHRLMQEGDVISGAFLSIDPHQAEALYRRLKETPRLAGVSVKEAAIESFQKTVAENQQRMQSFNIMFACVIAFGVVYNTARISLAERSRELATLRVIGFTRGEISGILLGELAVLTLAAIPLGLLIGYGFCYLIVWGFETEMYRIPLVINPSTYGFAASVTLLASLLSGLVVRRRLDHLDLVSVLKSRE